VGGAIIPRLPMIDVGTKGETFELATYVADLMQHLLLFKTEFKNEN
jgi:hypothetical protein